jgi:hypothetical protein
MSAIRKDDIAYLQSGTGEKIGQYRRLIAAGCGGTGGSTDVDSLMTHFLEVSSALCHNQRWQRLTVDPGE